MLNAKFPQHIDMLKDTSQSEFLCSDASIVGYFTLFLTNNNSTAEVKRERRLLSSRFTQVVYFCVIVRHISSKYNFFAIYHIIENLDFFLNQWQ